MTGPPAASALLMPDERILVICALAVAAAGLIAGVYLFFTLKREIIEEAVRTEARFQGMETKFAELKTAVMELAEKPTEPAHLPIPGFNLSIRTRALRMSRRGSQPEQIAAALGVPENEVKLLLKVQEYGGL